MIKFGQKTIRQLEDKLSAQEQLTEETTRLHKLKCKGLSDKCSTLSGEMVRDAAPSSSLLASPYCVPSEHAQGKLDSLGGRSRPMAR